MHPITDKAEVTIDFPDKFYMGAFGRDCSFDAHADADGMVIRLVHADGEKRQAEMHLHHFLFASILEDLARSLGEREPIGAVHREPLLEAVRKLAAALEPRAPPAA